MQNSNSQNRIRNMLRQATRFRRRPDAAVFAMLGVVIVTLAMTALSPTPFVVLAAGASLVAIIALLWTGNDLPILFFPVAYQWSEVSVKPITSAITSTPLNEFSQFGSNLEAGAIFGLVGVLALAIGLKIGAGRPRGDLVGAVRKEVMRMPHRRILLIGLGAIIIGHVLNTLSGYAGPARQIFLAFAHVKLAGIFVLAYWCFVRRKGYGILLAVLGFEIVTGMVGYFANFRGPVLMVFLAALAARPRLQPMDIVLGGLVGVVIISTAVFWTVVKTDYRNFVNAGTGEQVVVQPLNQRLNHLANEASAFSAEKYAEGFRALMFRHSYIDYLSRTLEYVPAAVPHENGARLTQSVTHILMPRIFFPNKPALIGDSEITARYTGLPTYRHRGTSISLGYLTELYVDFGRIGAWAAVLGLGMAFGYLYRILMRRAGKAPLVSYGLAAMWAFGLAAFGTALIKLTGAMVITFIAALLIQRSLWPLVARQLDRRPKRPVRA